MLRILILLTPVVSSNMMFIIVSVSWFILKYSLTILMIIVNTTITPSITKRVEKLFCMLDFKRLKNDMEATVVGIEYDPTRSEKIKKFYFTFIANKIFIL